MKKQKAEVVEVSTPVLFTLNDKARAMAELEIGGPTLQTPGKGLGKGWRLAGYTQPNTRVAALAAILATCGDKFTAPDAEAALASAKKEGLNLGTGSPRSYVVAFIKNGYLTQA
jgi:hypothetical protein